MRIYRRLPTIQSGIATKRRKFWLIAASTLASAFLGVSEPALAQDFPTTGNPYSNGINVGNTGTPTTVTLDPGVVVNVTPGNNVNQAVAISTGTNEGAGLPGHPDCE
jgi:hypothetical protein